MSLVLSPHRFRVLGPVAFVGSDMDVIPQYGHWVEVSHHFTLQITLSTRQSIFNQLLEHHLGMGTDMANYSLSTIEQIARVIPPHIIKWHENIISISILTHMGMEGMFSVFGKIHFLNIITLMNQDANTTFGQTVQFSTIGKILLKVVLLETALNSYTIKSNV